MVDKEIFIRFEDFYANMDGGFDVLLGKVKKHSLFKSMVFNFKEHLVNGLSIPEADARICAEIFGVNLLLTEYAVEEKNRVTLEEVKRKNKVAKKSNLKDFKNMVSLLSSEYATEKEKAVLEKVAERACKKNYNKFVKESRKKYIENPF